MSESLLKLVNLGCERDDRLLFTHLNLSMAAGELVQISGANGTGKTTLLRMIAGLLPLYQGDILYRGRSLGEDRWYFSQDSIYLGHLTAIKKSLTPEENLQWFAAQQPVRASAREALCKVGLRGFESTPCDQLSAGQYRRVALARLVMTRVSIWILDEPFTAIDKSGVEMLEMLLAEHQQQGGLTLLTSHQDLALPNITQIHLADYTLQGVA
jgi:heme exporter protein A